MACDSLLGAHCIDEGLAGADFNANKAHASLSDALLKLDITFELNLILVNNSCV
jgi:hypothetical protein